MFKRLAAAVVLVLLVAGCAPNHGRVSGHWTWTSLDCAAYSTYRSMKGKLSTQCSLWLPRTHYELHLTTSQHDGNRQVSAYEYHQYPNGAQYP